MTSASSNPSDAFLEKVPLQDGIVRRDKTGEAAEEEEHDGPFEGGVSFRIGLFLEIEISPVRRGVMHGVLENEGLVGDVAHIPRIDGRTLDEHDRVSSTYGPRRRRSELLPGRVRVRGPD